MTLAHALNNEVEAAYRRGELSEKRRRLVDDGADYCEPDGAAGAQEGSRYRWLPPWQCLEKMEIFPSLKGRTPESLHELLFQAVSRGDIRAMLYDAVVPKAHIKVYLTLYLHCANQSSNILPSDLALSYHDLCAKFDRRVVDNQQPRRTAKEHSGWPEDRALPYERHGTRTGDATGPAISAAKAAGILLTASSDSRGGTPENRAKRVLRAFLKCFYPAGNSHLRPPTRNCVAREARHLDIQ